MHYCIVLPVLYALTMNNSSRVAPNSEGISHKHHTKLTKNETVSDIPQDKEKHLELNDQTAMLEEYRAKMGSVLKLFLLF